MELVHYAGKRNSLIIEDDFENEFVYLQKPTPSLYSLAGGHGVIYIGSFSRLLLPSIRLSFMVLPPALTEKYRLLADHYNQTASKAEQIALCQFIRDGHLTSQTRRLRRLYSQKTKILVQEIQDIFGKNSQIQLGAAGTSLALTVSCRFSGNELKKKALARGMRLNILKEEPDNLTLLLSGSSMASEKFRPALQLLKEILE